MDGVRRIPMALLLCVAGGKPMMSLTSFRDGIPSGQENDVIAP